MDLDRGSPYSSLLCCCLPITSLMLQKKLHPKHSIFSQAKGINLRSANVTVSLAVYVAPRVIQRWLSVTLRQPLWLHLLSTCISNCFGSITPWQACYSVKASLTMLMLILNVPSHMQSIIHTFWVMQWNDRLGFCITSTGLRRQVLRPWVLLVFLRSLGWQRTWRTVGGFCRKSRQE